MRPIEAVESRIAVREVAIAEKVQMEGWADGNGGDEEEKSSFGFAGIGVFESK